MTILPSLTCLVVASNLCLAEQQHPFLNRWHVLNQTLDGRLFQGSPLSLPCFLNSSSADCLALKQSYTDEVFRSQIPGGYINTQWETCQSTNEGCLLDPNHVELSRCSLGSISPYFIDIRSPSDVIAAFEFSKKHGVDIVIKNTGHDYKGRSSAPNSLALWMHNLKDISYNPTFKPACDDGPGQPAMTLGAGVQWHEAYGFAEKHNLTIVGGTDRSVGVSGGWIQGGGHSLLSNTLGLGVDRVLEFTLVTPDGVLRTANRCENEDLFFALRGGGGGTFGVVLSSTHLVVPNPVPVSAVIVSWTAPHGSLTEEFWNIMADNAIQWTNEGWGALARSQVGVFVNPKLTKTQAEESLKPLLDFGQRIPGAKVAVLSFASYSEFFRLFSTSYVASVGTPLALSSRLITKPNFGSPQSRLELVKGLVSANEQTPGVLILMTTPASFKYSAGETSVTEAWRESIYHVTAIQTWAWNSTTGEKKEAYEKVSKSIGELRKITKDAAYLNEADVYEPNHETSFWGSNYERLLEIKNRYDPDRLLDCWQCVGWNPNSTRFKCYL